MVDHHSMEIDEPTTSYNEPRRDPQQPDGAINTGE